MPSTKLFVPYAKHPLPGEGSGHLEGGEEMESAARNKRMRRQATQRRNYEISLRTSRKFLHPFPKNLIESPRYLRPKNISSASYMSVLARFS